MGMPPDCNCLCAAPADYSSSSSSSGSLFDISGCGCVIQARTWRVTSTWGGVNATCAFMQNVTVTYRSSCQWDSGCLRIDSGTGLCCFIVTLSFGPSDVIVRFAEQASSPTAYTYSASFASLGITPGGSCLGTHTIPRISLPNDVDRPCCPNAFVPSPTSVQISPA